MQKERRIIKRHYAIFVILFYLAWVKRLGIGYKKAYIGVDVINWTR